MKFELKTENENYLKSFSDVVRTIFFISFLIVFCDLSLKLGNISRHYQINYNCRLLAIKKSANNFKKLSSLSKLESKQRIWEFCKDFAK
jgi:hypothetical protein